MLHCGLRIQAIVIGCLVALGCYAADTTASSTDTSQADRSKLEEIVVTAQKVPEKLQDVPLSVQVLSAGELESQGLINLTDYSKLIPGLYIGGNGSPGQGFPVLRGVSTGADSTSLVAIYLDDVSFTANGHGYNSESNIFDPDVADLDHIEVLEGPQSTLYGASAEDGIIKYVTKQPDLSSVTGSVQVDGSHVDGGSSGYGVRSSVNIPIIADEIAMRASVFYREDPGFIDNSFNGARNVNWDEVEGGRLAVLFKISDDLQTTISGVVQHSYTPVANGVYLNPQTLQPSLGELAFTSPQRLSNSEDRRAVADTTKWDLHFATLTNIASYVSSYTSSFTDFSAFAAYVQAPPDTGASFQSVQGSTRLTDELRLASAPGPLEYLFGAYYTHERDYNYQYNHGTDADGEILPSSSPFYDIYTYDQQYHYHEWALFGDLTYHFTDQIEATAGIRHSANQQMFAETEGGALVGNAIVQNGNSSNDSANTYLGTITYKPISNLTAYLRASSAYRPGGTQYLPFSLPGVGSHYGPDSMWNYEAGLKGSLFDQRVTYSADIFDMRWKDLQLSAQSGGLAYQTNVGSARSEGAEASVQFIPLQGLTVSVKGAYIDAIITADVPFINAVNGQALPYSPRWTGASTADYRMTLANGITPTMGATYAYHGPSNTGFTGAEEFFGVSSGVFVLHSYATLDLRSGFDWSRYSFIARVNNVTNKYGVTQAAYNAANPAALEGIVIQPRTFGVSLAAHF